MKHKTTLLQKSYRASKLVASLKLLVYIKEELDHRFALNARMGSGDVIMPSIAGGGEIRNSK